MKFAALPLVAAALLAGCATPVPRPGEPAWTSGRLSLRVDATAAAPAQSLSAGFELQGGAQAGELRLNSPLGTRMVSARWSPGLAVLTTAEGERRFAGLDALSQQALGEALPLAALPDWLAGRPWPQAAHRSTTTGFEQLGWSVDLGQRDQGRVEAHRLAPPAVLLRVRLDNPQP